MGFIKDSFSDSKNIIEVRYMISRVVFLFFALVFFINYFFVWASFYLDLFSLTLPFSYIFFLLSLLLFIYFFAKKKFLYKINFIFEVFFVILLFVIFTIFLVPFVFEDFIF